MARLLVVAAIALAALATPASAKDGPIGYDGGTVTTECFGGVSTCTYLAFGPLAATAPADGTITQYSFQHGATDGTVESQLVVFDTSQDPPIVKRKAAEKHTLAALTPAGTATHTMVTPLDIDAGESLGIILKGANGVPNLRVEAGTVDDYTLMCSNEPGVAGSGYDCGLSELTMTTVALSAFFYSDIRPPAVTPVSADAIGPFGATLKAQVHSSVPAQVYFKYAKTCAGVNQGTQTPTTNLPGGDTAVEVSRAITDLDPETTYCYRAYATNETDTTTGDSRSFMTADAPAPVLTATQNPTVITGTTATLTGTVNPNAKATDVFVEYGTSDPPVIATGKTTFTGRTVQNLSRQLTGLTTDTTYHWRWVAEREGVRVAESPVYSFKTRKPPAAIAGSVTDVGEDAATLAGTVTSFGSETDWRFEYGKTTGYGADTGWAVVGSGSGSTPQPVSKRITGLEPDTEYHWRLVATSAGGDAVTSDGTFRTAKGKAPALADFVARNITGSTARLEFNIDVQGYATVFEVEYGPTAEYGNRNGKSPESNTTRGFQGASSELSQLAPGTTYHYRVVASNRWGTTVGPDQTFTTLPVPAVTSLPAVEIGQFSALLPGTVDPKGAATSYYVEYGHTTGYGFYSSSADAGAGSGPVGVAIRLGNLAPGTAYHWRLVAESAGGRAYSEDRVFVTAPAYLPEPEWTVVVLGFDTYLTTILKPVGLVVTRETSFGRLFVKVMKDGKATRSEQKKLLKLLAAYDKAMAAAQKVLAKANASGAGLTAEQADEVSRLKSMRKVASSLKKALKKRSAGGFRKAYKGYLKAKARKSKLVAKVDERAKEIRGKGAFDKKVVKPVYPAHLVGTWRASHDGSTITLAGDGRYTTSGGGSGTWRGTADGVLFAGAVTYNGGRAKVKGGVMEFYWKARDGSISYFVFTKG